MRHSILFVLNCCLSACVTSSPTDPYGGIVVERSKELPPAWIELPVGRLHETPDLLRYVEMQSQHTDLPFGIKRAQTDALEASKHALKERVKNDLIRLGNAKQLFTVDPPQEIDQMIMEVTDEIHRQYAKVADIYFEKLRADEPIGPRQITEYYRAQVLVHFPKKQLPELMKALAQRLQGSTNQMLQALGRSLHATGVEEITH